MRISDWSSDVCSSDLRCVANRHHVTPFHFFHVDPPSGIRSMSISLSADRLQCSGHEARSPTRTHAASPSLCRRALRRPTYGHAGTYSVLDNLTRFETAPGCARAQVPTAPTPGFATLH